MRYAAHVSRGRRGSSHFLRRLQGSLLFSPPILIIVLSLFLFRVGQIREILIRVVEHQNTNCEMQLVLGFGAFAFLTGMLFFSYLSACVVLRQTGIGYGSSLVYGSETELMHDRRIARWRDAVALLVAALPIIAIGLAFSAVSEVVRKDRLLVGQPVATYGLPPLQLCAADSSELAPQLAHVALGWIALSVVLLLALFIFSRLQWLRDWRPRLRRTRTRRPRTLTYLAVAALLLPIPLINLEPSWNEELFNFLGPLATLGLVLLSTAWLLFVIGEKSRTTGIPFFLIITILVFVVGLYLWASTPVPDYVAPKEQARNGEKVKLQADFEAWLRSRGDAGTAPDAAAQVGPRRPYPVYVIAAPGGGIYAASFLASVVSRIEQHCPGFSQHVFAISAVSGGAIGSSIINAVTRASKQVGRVRCLDPAPPRDPQVAFVKAMLSDDHLSPTMASTIPDVIVKLGLIAAYEIERRVVRHPSLIHLDGRAEALEESFTEAVRRACSQIEGRETLAVCTNTGAGPFRDGFDHHWHASGVAPALLLNTTWAETGQRIAFSPFPLAGIGDDTLKSMTELKGPGSESLIEAAVASARFPAVLPAMIHSKTDPQLWWNFVDGGYADASGTTTALELYKAIEQRQADIERNTGIALDLKLLLLTESSASTEMPSGAGLSHAISPITTLLTIRDQIGRRAVARARNELPPVDLTAGADTAPLDCDATGKRWRMREILLDSSTIGLPLGWMLSRHKADMIDRLVNMPDNVRHDENKHAGKVAEQNKETFRAIRESLTGSCNRSASR